jgi:predicted amidohydrolase
MKIALYQMEDRGDAAINIDHAQMMISSTSADFFVLPEFFAIPGGDYKKNYTLEECWQQTGQPAIDMLKRASTKFPGYIIGGSVIEKGEDSLYFNTCFVFKQSVEITKYRKISITDEEKYLNITPGNTPVYFNTNFGKVGIIICADCCSLSISDKAASYADILFLPVSLTDPNHPPFKGHPLSQAISKKHNCIVIKATRVGTFNGEKLTSISAITTPEGTIFEAGRKEELAIVEI